MGNPSVCKICTRMTKGWVVACDQLIEDVDKASGARFSRDGLDAMMAEIKKGRIDVSA